VATRRSIPITRQYNFKGVFFYLTLCPKKYYTDHAKKKYVENNNIASNSLKEVVAQFKIIEINTIIKNKNKLIGPTKKVTTTGLI